MEFIEQYKDILKLSPHGLRGRLRAAALDGLSIVDRMQGMERLLEKPRVQFLYIHHVFKDEEQQLDALLKQLSVHHQFISHSEAVSKILTGNIDKPCISISSDDGFKNNIRAAEIMDRYGAKGCFFVNPYIIEEKKFEKIEAYCKDVLHFPPVEFMDWKDVEELKKRGHEIGSHTMRHMDVARTDPLLFAEDCQLTFEILKGKCGEVDHFAFPYGRFSNFNESGRKTVFEAGFTSCASAERGCHVKGEVPPAYQELCIRRDHVVLLWKIEHILHFVVNSARHASSTNNSFPYSTR